MNFDEWQRIGAVYQHDPYLHESDNRVEKASQYAWGDCKNEILNLLTKYNRSGDEHLVEVIKRDIEKNI